MRGATVRIVLVVLVAVAAVLTVTGLVVWWPRSDPVTDTEALEETGYGDDLAWARVTGIETVPCVDEVDQDCRSVSFEVTGGRAEGETSSIESAANVRSGITTLDEGDRFRVHVFEVSPEVPAAEPSTAEQGASTEYGYAFADVERHTGLWVLAIFFVAAVVALGRWRGLLALSGVAVSLVVILVFVFPALLHDSPPVGVAATGAGVIAFATLYLAHGVHPRTTVSLLGTLASLLLIGILAFVFARVVRLTGLADDEALQLLTFAPDLDFRGLLLAAIIIGALGVLDDVTVTQTAAVWELHRADPTAGPWKLYRAGVRIGRDHIAATVNTLVLAYTAGAMPLLLLVSQSGLSLAEVATNETIAVEIVQTLIGSIGLVAAVPVTTALAAWVVTHGDPGVVGAEPFGTPPPPPPERRPPYKGPGAEHPPVSHTPPATHDWR